jgi:hypothetical protein
MGGSSLQCLFNFVDLHLASHGFEAMAPMFKHGMPDSEEFSLPLGISLPNLPERGQLEHVVNAFFSRIWPLYPVIDRPAVDYDIDALCVVQASGVGDMTSRIQSIHLPKMAAIYAVVSIGFMEGPAPDATMSLKYLTASFSLQGHLMATPYFASAQALLLLALALRAHGKDGQAWNVIGQAIRVSMSIGLHKPVTKTISSREIGGRAQTNDLRDRLWWSCYALEKLLQLECGRPWSIEPDYDHLALSCAMGTDPEGASELTYFFAWVSLAGVMGHISEQLYSHSFSSSDEMFAETARLDRALLEWETSVPERLRPRYSASSGFVDADDTHQVLSAFLAQQYYHVKCPLDIHAKPRVML